MLRIGTAGWTIRREHAAEFPAGSSHLSRHSTRLNAVEINSSFHRPHRPQTYARWARETPDGFSFSVKMSRHITHELRLTGAEMPLQAFLGECGELGDKLDCVLIQLPPRLAFDPKIGRQFLASLRRLYQGGAAIEPRHASWFTAEADKMLASFRIARVAADPVPAKMAEVEDAAAPGGFRGLEYWRLHGSPRIYYANYEPAFLAALARRLKKAAKTKDVWCIFDNTVLGHATTNALELTALTV